MASNKTQEGPMKQICRSCKSDLNTIQEQSSQFNITGGICISCKNKVSKIGDSTNSRKILESIDAPVLLMQPEPRQVYTANNKALELFGKDLSQTEGYRGGEVFDCVLSLTEAGCGKDVNCENCKIKNAIVETFASGRSFEGVSTSLKIKKGGEINTYLLEISTERVGDLALVKIEQYNCLHSLPRLQLATVRTT